MILQFFDNPSHRQSEERAFEAERALRKGEENVALAAYADAARLEEGAALAVPSAHAKVRTVLAISAVSLWMKGAEWAEAARCGANFLRDVRSLTRDGKAELGALTATARELAITNRRVTDLVHSSRQGRAAHEARIVSAESGRTSREPVFVAQALRRWDAFWSAAGGTAAGMDVALMGAGSLRVVFTAPPDVHKRVVARYQEIVECGDDVRRLRGALRDGGTLEAYYNLVNFLSSNKASLELARAGAARQLAVLDLSAAIAETHRAALAKPVLDTEAARSIVARVTSASMTKHYLELEVVGGGTIEGVVDAASQHRLHGLRIGHSFEFVLSVTTKRENPGAKQHVEFHIQDVAEKGLVTHITGHAAATKVVRRALKPRVWSKRLSATDALQNKGNELGYVRLTGKPHAWFRDDLFGALAWQLDAKHGDERVRVDFRVAVMGVQIGAHDLPLTYDPRRVQHHLEPTTRLYWDGEIKELLRMNDFSRKYLVLRRDKEGVLFLEISPEPPPEAAE